MNRCGYLMSLCLSFAPLACAGESESGSGTLGGSSAQSMGGGTLVNGGASSTAKGGASARGGTSGAGVGQGGAQTSKGGTSSTSASGGAQTGGASSTSSSGGAQTSKGGSSSTNSAGGTSTGGTSTGGTSTGGGTATSIVERCDLSTVFSAFPVGFSLLTSGTRQFAAYYDANRQMTVASRTIGSCTWTKATLASTIGWDSHNYIAMDFDGDGYLHLAGNMHSSPLVYFKTSKPWDITTFEKQVSMVGSEETQCTYPQFFRNAAGELIFMYRSGVSGNGNHYFNKYSTVSKTWSRLLGTALTNGTANNVNAYPVGPIQGPDNRWHLVWVWRETADASTNRDLSYARTSDLVNWQKANGQALTLPITLTTGDIVDPVPTKSGMINNNTKVGFDAQNRPIVAYHKYDTSGYTQLYNARFENGAWKVYKTSNWTSTWSFGGTGTLVFDVEVFPVELQPDGTLTQNWYNKNEGGLGAFRLNPTTLAAEAKIPQPVPYPAELAKVESTYANMGVRWQKDSGKSPDPNTVYLLRWETLPSNRDQAVSPIPPATALRLYGFRVK